MCANRSQLKQSNSLDKSVVTAHFDSHYQDTPFISQLLQVGNAECCIPSNSHIGFQKP